MSGRKHLQIEVSGWAVMGKMERHNCRKHKKGGKI